MKFLHGALASIVVCSTMGTLPASSAGLAYLSTQGADANPCTKTLPCRNIVQGAAAISSDGVITMLDEGEYNATSISGNLTIQGQGPGSVILNPGASVGLLLSGNIALRDLSIEAYASNPGSTGVEFASGQSLNVENVTIRHQSSSSFGSYGITIDAAGNPAVLLKKVHVSFSGIGSSYGTGLWIRTDSGETNKVVVDDSSFDYNARGIRTDGAGNLQLTLSDTTISNSIGDGVLISPSGGTTRLVIQNSRLVNNGGNGVMLAPTGSAKVLATIIGSGLDANVIGVRSFPASPAISNLSISDSSVSNNVGGIHASGKSVVGIIRGNVSGNSSYGITAVSPAAIRVGSSMVNANTLGLSGPVSSYGNNQLHGNTTPGSSTPVAPAGAP